MISGSSVIQLIISIFFSVILEPDIDQGYSSLYLNPTPIGEIATKSFPVRVFYIIWESKCSKMAVAR